RLEGDTWQEAASATVGGRIIAPPAVVSVDGQFALCVAHADAVADKKTRVTLLVGEGLRKVRDWIMSDNITAGPFVRGKGIGRIVGGRRLVWLDPAKDEPHYAHTFRADIVGQPELVDGLLIVADLEGAIQAVDPQNKRFVGLSYTLQANVAPTA